MSLISAFAFERDSSVRRPLLGSVVMPVWTVTLLKGCLLGLIYHLGTRLGFLLTPPSHPISAFWPPNALLLAVLLLSEMKQWPWLIVAIIPAHLAAQLPVGIPVLTAMGWFCGNVGEAVIGALLLRRFTTYDQLFRTVRGTALFLAFGAFLPPLVTSFFDAGVVVLTKWGTEFWMIWATRLLSNILAELTIVPAVVGLYLWTRSAKNKPEISLKYVELLALWASLFTACSVMFTNHLLSASYIPLLTYLPFPLLLWAAVRFGPGMLSAATLLVTLSAARNFVNGSGFFGVSNALDYTLALQIVVCLVFVPLLLLCSLMAEKQSLVYSLWLSRGKIVHAQEEERSRMAREIHDDFGQRLTTFQLELYDVGRRSPANLRLELEALRSEVSGLIEDMRSMSHSLHPHLLEIAGLRTALTEHCTRVAKTTGVAINLSIDITPEILPPNIALSLYRVIQEALTNVEKHSAAEHVSVNVKQRLRRVLLTIIDDGRGFTPRTDFLGLGLVGMQERADSIGATFTILSRPGRGTTIALSLPVDPSENRPAA
jgi:signal transduction histidine kinase